MLKIGLFLLIVPLLALLTGYFAELSDVNHCIQQGGYYNYEVHTCDFENKQPYIPYLQRNPAWVNMAFLLSLVGLVLCFIGLYKGRR